MFFTYFKYYNEETKSKLLNFYKFINPRFFRRNIFANAILENIDYKSSVERTYCCLSKNRSKSLAITNVS